jgi:hypothetical protein
MLRSIAIFVGGLAIGSLISLAVVKSPHPQKNADFPAASAAGNQRKSIVSSVDKSPSERTRVLLGNIKTVPFQELYGVLMNCSAEERAQMAQQLADLPPGRESKVKISTFFKAWAHLDSIAAMTAAVSFKAAEARNSAMSAVISGSDGISAGALAGMIDHLAPETLPAVEKIKFLNRALSKWSEVDPVAAAGFLDASPSAGKGLLGARVTIAGNWAESDPEAALAWVQTHAEGRELATVMSGVINGWWHTDPRAAEAYVASHLDTLGQQTIINLTRQLISQDVQQAKDWAAALPNVEARRRTGYFIAAQLASSDPKAAGDWAASLPDDVRRTVIDGVINTWIRKDPQEAAQWLNTLAGPPRDEAVTAFSSAIAPKDPAAALTWAATVSDARLRDVSMQRIAEGWIRRNSTQARAWIQTSGLPDAEKTRLLALAEHR